MVKVNRGIARKKFRKELKCKIFGDKIFLVAAQIFLLKLTKKQKTSATGENFFESTCF